MAGCDRPPREGYHHGYRHPGAGVRVKTDAKIGGMHLDVRGDGGFCVLPPSVHHSGRAYRFEPPCKGFPIRSLDELPVFEPEKCRTGRSRRCSGFRSPLVAGRTGRRRIGWAWPSGTSNRLPPAVEARRGTQDPEGDLHVGWASKSGRLTDALEALRAWNARCQPRGAGPNWRA